MLRFGYKACSATADFLLGTTYRIAENQRLRDFLRTAKDPRNSGRGLPNTVQLWTGVHQDHEEKRVRTYIAEHKQCCRLYQREKSTVVKRGLLPNHNNLFENTEVNSMTEQFYPRLYREAIEIHKH